MYALPKIVVSTTLRSADWPSSRLVNTNVREQVEQIKRETGKDLLVLGSPNLTVSLMNPGVVDELRIMVHPVALGSGKSAFHSMEGRLRLELLRSEVFASGSVPPCYRPGPPLASETNSS